MKSKLKSLCILSCVVLFWTALVPSNLWAAQKSRSSSRSASTTRSTSGSSVRQANVNKNTNVNQNVNVNRNVNVNTNTNVNRSSATRTYQGEDVAVAAGPRGAVAVGEEGAAAVGRYGAVAVGEEGAAAVGRYGAVAVGEEGAAAVGRYGGAAYRGEYYEDYDGWKVAAGVATGIAIGTMLAKPPAASTTIVVTGTSYYYNDYVFYAQVYHQGQVVYQAIPAPAGAIIVTLTPGCAVKVVGGVSYQYCKNTYYMRVSNGYRVVVF